MAGRIGFPRSEWASIRRRLARYGDVCTTRVSRELGRYRRGRRYLTPWGRELKVIAVRRYDRLERHPFIRRLTPAQKKIIIRYKRYEVVRLASV